MIYLKLIKRVLRWVSTQRAGGVIPNLKFKCPVCNGSKFIFTTFCPDKHYPHGAVCSVCGVKLTAKTTIPKRRRWKKVA